MIYSSEPEYEDIDETELSLDEQDILFAILRKTFEANYSNEYILMKLMELYYVDNFLDEYTITEKGKLKLKQVEKKNNHIKR